MKDVQGKPDREVEPDADDGGCDGRERAGQPSIGAQRLDVRRAEKNPRKAGNEGDPGHERRADDAAGPSSMVSYSYFPAQPQLARGRSIASERI